MSSSCRVPRRRGRRSLLGSRLRGPRRVPRCASRLASFFVLHDEFGSGEELLHLLALPILGGGDEEVRVRLGRDSGGPLAAGHLLRALGRERTQAARGGFELSTETVTRGPCDDDGEFGDGTREEIQEGRHMIGGEFLLPKTVGAAERREEAPRSRAGRMPDERFD